MGIIIKLWNCFFKNMSNHQKGFLIDFQTRRTWWSGIGFMYFSHFLWWKLSCEIFHQLIFWVLPLNSWPHRSWCIDNFDSKLHGFVSERLFFLADKGLMQLEPQITPWLRPATQSFLPNIDLQSDMKYITFPCLCIPCLVSKVNVEEKDTKNSPH